LRARAGALAAAMSQAVGRPVTEQEALYWVTMAAEASVDTRAQSSVQFIRGLSISEEAQLYDLALRDINANARGATFVDSRGQTQTYFVATPSDRNNTFVYSEFRNDAEYRDFMWVTTGRNLLPDNPTANDLALYAQRRDLLLQGTIKDLLTTGGLALLTRAGVGAANRLTAAGSFRTTPTSSPPLRQMLGVDVDSNLPPPASGYDYTPSVLQGARSEAQANSHVEGYRAEIRLANEVASLDYSVVKWGDKVGGHGSDIVSVNPRTGEVVLWDSKFRSSDVGLQQSPTFSDSSRRAAAVDEALKAIQSSSLAPEVKNRALQNLTGGNFTTNTAGSGGARNSVQVRYCGDNPC
jgi:hypothetical protein